MSEQFATPGLLRDQLAASRAYLRETLWAAGPKALNGVAVLAVNLYVMRHISLAEYGVFSVCAATLILFDALLGSAFDIAVLQEASLADINRSSLVPVETAGIHLKLLLGICVITLTAVAGPRAGLGLFGNSEVHGALVMLAIAVTALMYFRSLQVHHQSRLRFKSFGGLELVYTCTRVGLVLLVSSLGLATSVTLMACYAAAPLLPCLLQPKLALAGFAGFPLAQRASMRTLLRFTGVSFLTIGVGAIGGRMDLFLVGAGSNAVQAGLFSAALTIAMIPEMIGSYLAPVLSTRIMRWSDQGRLFGSYFRVQTILWAVGLLMVILGVLLVDNLAGSIFPARFAAAAGLMKILLPGAAGGFILFPATVSLLLFFSPRTLLFFDACTLPVLAVAYYYVAASHGAVGVAWLSSGARVAKLLFIQVAAFRIARRMDRDSALVASSAGAP